jgi:hypothetical protein
MDAESEKSLGWIEAQHLHGLMKVLSAGKPKLTLDAFLAISLSSAATQE